jgi:hypothetical protein
MPLKRYIAHFTPADLAVLRNVFDKICEERQIDPRSVDGELLAAEIVALRGSGLEEEQEFLRVLGGTKNRSAS